MCLYSWDYTINHDEHEDENKKISLTYVIKKLKPSKCKRCLNLMQLMHIKQHLSNIQSSIHENVKQH